MNFGDKLLSQRVLRKHFTSAAYNHGPKELRVLGEQILFAVYDHDPEKLDRLLQERNALIKKQQQQNQDSDDEDMVDDTDIKAILEHAATHEYTQCPEAFNLLYENFCKRTKRLYSGAAGVFSFEYHFSPLHWAAKQGLVDLVQWLVEKQVCNVNQDHPRYHGTPIKQAIHAGQSNVVRVLVEKHGATLSITDVISALSHKSTEIIAFLVQYQVISMKEFIAMLRREVHGHSAVQDRETIVAIVRIFVQRIKTDFEAANHLLDWFHEEMDNSFRIGNINHEACTLLEAGMSGHAFLYRAIQYEYGHATVCRLLVEQHGINPLLPGGGEGRDDSGKFLLAPLNAAAQLQNLGILVQFLDCLRKPRNIDVVQHHQQQQSSNPHGDLVMHVLCRSPHVTIQAIQLAVDQYKLGSTLDVANNEGLRPVHIAAKSGVSISVLYYLLRQCPEALGHLPPLPANNNNSILEALQAQFDALRAEKETALTDKEAEISRLLTLIHHQNDSEMEVMQKASSIASTNSDKNSSNDGGDINSVVDPASTGLIVEQAHESMNDDAATPHTSSKKAKTGH